LLEHALRDDAAHAAGHRHQALGSSGDVIEGPAIIREELSTTQVCPGQTATVGSYGEIVIERA